MPSLDFVVGGEGTAEHRRDAQHGKELARDALRARVGRLARSRSAAGTDAAPTAASPSNDCCTLAPVEIGLRRGRAAAERRRPLGVVLEHDAEPIVLVERQPAQDDGVDDREEGRPGADAEGQDSQGDDSKRPRREQGAEGTLLIVQHARLDAVHSGPGLRRGQTPNFPTPNLQLIPKLQLPKLPKSLSRWKLENQNGGVTS